MIEAKSDSPEPEEGQEGQSECQEGAGHWGSRHLEVHNLQEKMGSEGQFDEQVSQLLV